MLHSGAEAVERRYGMTSSLRLLVKDFSPSVRRILHPLRALKMRICFRLGLPSGVPDVPEDDWEGLTRLRFKLAAMATRPQAESVVPEMSGVHTKHWHPLDRLARRYRQEQEARRRLGHEN